MSWLDDLIPKCSFQTHKDCRKGGCWNEPGSVPDCLLTSFEKIEWRRYKGTKDQEWSCDLYIEEFLSFEDGEDIHWVRWSWGATWDDKKLAFSPRASITCQVDFDWKTFSIPNPCKYVMNEEWSNSVFFFIVCVPVWINDWCILFILGLYHNSGW